MYSRRESREPGVGGAMDCGTPTGDFKEMMAMDVADSAQVYTAFLVYMDLLEVRNWHDVKIHGSSELHLIYLHGLEKEGCIPQLIIPTPVSMSYSHERIQQFMKLDCTSDEAQSISSILLAIVESDSTVVYYKLTDGFVIPDPPDFVEDMDNKQWRKKRLRHLR
uniref:tRNA splicing endonuclease subunit 15 n=1 Tax=Xenopus tropicalis TaxID=8364 RepID=A0A6I8RSE9_XENTR